MSDTKRTLSIISYFICLLLGTNVSASECGVMMLQDNRSNGVTVKKNDCNEVPYISIGTIIDISTKGRLWLKSNQSPMIGSRFQLICQNQSSATLQLEFSDMLTPWLSQSKLTGCTGWINNKLSCAGNNGEKNGIYCVLAIEKPGSGKTKSPKQIERTTSIKMRGLNSSKKVENDSINLDRNTIIDAIKSDVMLCKQLYRSRSAINVSWNITPDAQINDINVVLNQGPKKDNLTECVSAVIKTFNYPLYSEEIHFKHTF